MTISLPSQFTATCIYCSGVSSVTLTGAHDDLEVLCPRCGTHMGSVGDLKATKTGAVTPERSSSVATRSAH